MTAQRSRGIRQGEDIVKSLHARAYSLGLENRQHAALFARQYRHGVCSIELGHSGSLTVSRAAVRRAVVIIAFLVVSDGPAFPSAIPLSC